MGLQRNDAASFTGALSITPKSLTSTIKVPGLDNFPDTPANNCLWSWAPHELTTGNAAAPREREGERY